jgi:hypothetical protein
LLKRAARWQCLKKNLAKLSAGCQQAVKAATAASAPPASAPENAANPVPEEQASPPPEPPATTAAVPPSSLAPPGFIPPRKKLMLMRNCRSDFRALCPGIDVGGGRAVACLEDNMAALTQDCRDALAKLGR